MVKTRTLVACAVIAFAVALAVVVGNRMSAEAMAVVIGVVCGVAASIPMSAIILVLSQRSRPHPQDDRPPSTMPVVLVTPPTAAAPAPSWTGYESWQGSVLPTPRQYRVIGEDSP